MSHLSPSQIAMFKKCPRQWAYVYLEGRRVPPSGAQHLGSSFHRSAEAHNVHKVATKTDLPVDEVEDRYSAAFKAVPESEIAWEDESPKRLYDDGAQMVRLFGATSAKEIQPTHVEQKVLIPLESEEPLPPLLTVLDVVDDRSRVIDYKTKSRAAPADEAANSEQLSAYAIAHRSAFGAFPSALLLEVFVRPQKTRPTGFRDTQTTTRGDAQADAYLQDLRAVASQIEHGRRTGLFPFAPADSWACSPKFCGFYAICAGGASRRVSVPVDGLAQEGRTA